MGYIDKPSFLAATPFKMEQAYSTHATVLFVLRYPILRITETEIPSFESLISRLSGTKSVRRMGFVGYRSLI